MPYGIVSQQSGYKRKKGNANRTPSMFASRLSRNLYGARSQPVLALVPKRRFKKSYGQVGPEMKFLDVQQSQSYNAGAQVVSINSIAQGLTNITRIGNKINIKSVAVRFSSIPVDTNVAVLPNTYKWCLVLDKEPEAAAVASYNQIFTGNSMTAFRNVGESDRFVVLATGTWAHGGRQVVAPIYSDGGDMSNIVDKFVKCDIATKYTLTTATQTAFGTNQLLITTIAEQTDANVSQIIDTRIRFTDE